MQKERFKAPIAVYLIVKNDNDLLLSSRQGTGYMDGYYGLVSGHVEENEPARYACIREAMEEAEIQLKINDIKPTCIMHSLTPSTEYVDMFFIIENYKGNIENKEPNKCGGLKYFNINNLPDNIIDYIKVGIHNSLNGIFYCEYGFDDKLYSI